MAHETTSPGNATRYAGPNPVLNNDVLIPPLWLRVSPEDAMRAHMIPGFPAGPVGPVSPLPSPAGPVGPVDPLGPCGPRRPFFRRWVPAPASGGVLRRLASAVCSPRTANKAAPRVWRVRRRPVVGQDGTTATGGHTA